MSWESYYEYDEQSSCACGKGIVVKYCYCKDGFWGRVREGHTGIEIQCPECQSKYHYDSIIRRSLTSWDGEDFDTSEYLVPNGLKIPKVITARSYFGGSAKEDIVCLVTKQKLQDVIEDMKASKYSTRVQMPESKTIVDICSKRLHTRSLNKIVPMLQEILSSYEQYEWNPDTIAEYKKKEKEKIQRNEDTIADVILKSYQLHFHRKPDNHADHENQNKSVQPS